MSAPLPRPHLRQIAAYDPGHDLTQLRARHGGLLCELGANENPLGPSPSALAAFERAAASVHRYPDPSGRALKAALAARHRHPEQGIVLGNGSHELLVLLARCFAGPGDQVLFSRFGFAVFPIAAALAGAEGMAAPAFPEEHPRAFGHDPQALADALSSRVRLLFIANPNNPTGSWLSLAEIEALLAHADPQTLVVVDEAYQEYVLEEEPRSAVALLSRFPQLVVTRTFSKAYGLAALRVGYLLAHPEVACWLESAAGRRSTSTSRRRRQRSPRSAMRRISVSCARPMPASESAWRRGFPPWVSRFTHRARTFCSCASASKRRRSVRRCSRAASS